MPEASWEDPFAGASIAVIIGVTGEGDTGLSVRLMKPPLPYDLLLAEKIAGSSKDGEDPELDSSEEGSS